MIRTPRTPFAFAALLALGLLLAACGGATAPNDSGAPNDSDSPPPSATQADAFQNADAGVQAVLADLESDPAFRVLAPFGITTLSPAQLALGSRIALRDPALVFGGLERGLESMQDLAPLPRGSYAFDPASGWTRLGASGDLRGSWSSGDAEVLGIVDWEAPGATVTLASPYGSARYEAPTDASGSLAVDGSGVASADLLLDWADGAACGVSGPVTALPDGATLDARFGVRSTLELDGLTYAVSSSGVATRGTVTAETADAFEQLSWDVEVTAPSLRSPDDCDVEFSRVTALSVELSAVNEYAGARDGFDLALTVDDIFYDAYDGVSAFDVDGRLDVNGAFALGISGTFDGVDADGDGVVGENVVVTFADGATATLEELIEESAGAPAPLRALRSLLR